MRNRARWAGALLTELPSQFVVMGAPTAHVRGRGRTENGTIWVANEERAPANADTIRAFDMPDRGGHRTRSRCNRARQPGDLAVAKGKVYVAEERGPITCRGHR